MTSIAILDMPVKEGRRDEAVAILEVGLADTRAFEGNLGAVLLVDDDPAHFLILETWQSMEHNARYQAWRRTPEGETPGFGELLAGPSSMREYTIAP